MRCESSRSGIFRTRKAKAHRQGRFRGPEVGSSQGRDAAGASVLRVGLVRSLGRAQAHARRGWRSGDRTAQRLGAAVGGAREGDLRHPRRLLRHRRSRGSGGAARALGLQLEGELRLLHGIPFAREEHEELRLARCLKRRWLGHAALVLRDAAFAFVLFRGLESLDAHQNGPTCAHEDGPTARCRIFVGGPGSQDSNAVVVAAAQGAGAALSGAGGPRGGRGGD
jgi:hypothetical protein